MEFYGLTDIGRHRADNQDSFAVTPIAEEAILAVVCDGMGGAVGGKIASSLAVERFVAYVKEKIQAFLSIGFDKSSDNEAIIEGIMKQGVAEANAAVYNYAKDSIDLLGMGTTLVAVLVLGKEAYICNVGDSRLYHLTAHSMKQVTTDHSYVQMLIDNGLLAPELAAAHPDRNVITRAIGTRALVTPETFRLTLADQETLLLCSDGLSGYAANEEVYAIVWGSKEIYARPTAEKVKALIDTANANGGRDNITAVLLTF